MNCLGIFWIYHVKLLSRIYHRQYWAFSHSYIVENVTDWCKIVQDDTNDEDDGDGDDDIPHYTNIDISSTPGDQQAG